MRRDFLKLCGLAGLRLALPFRLPAAGAAEKQDEPYAGPYYVVFNASGGWDTTYLMDPKGVAACRGSSCPLAFLTFGNYSATGNLVAMSRVPYLPSLQKIANADSVEGNPRAPYHDRFALDRIEQALREGHEAASSQPRLPRA